MRHGATGRRSRSRGNGGGRSNHNRAQVFDSNGPDVRIRGSAHQICEKYVALAKDCATSGDLVLAESYLQHAEHYQRLINKREEEIAGQQRQTQSNKVAEQSKSNLPSHQKNTKKEDLGLPDSAAVKKDVVLENA